MTSIENSTMLTNKQAKKAEAAALKKAEKEAAKLLRQQEADRKKAEKEAAKLLRQQEVAAKKAEKEAAKLLRQQEADRKKAEKEAAKLLKQQEADKKKAEKEAEEAQIAELTQPLILTNPNSLNKYRFLIPEVNASDMSSDTKTILANLIKTTLESKQCNEPWEELLSDLLGLTNNPKKHGFDGTSVDGKEEYEYKPTKSKNIASAGGTINDDTIDKIVKCEQLITDGKQGWLVVGIVNSDTYTFDAIYKFPLEIYNESRRAYVLANIEKNKSTTNTKQTRSTYPITVSNSKKLCLKYKKPFYVWTRDD
jgi:hypothetical protein